MCIFGGHNLPTPLTKNRIHPTFQQIPILSFKPAWGQTLAGNFLLPLSIFPVSIEDKSVSTYTSAPFSTRGYGLSPRSRAHQSGLSESVYPFGQVSRGWSHGVKGRKQTSHFLFPLMSWINREAMNFSSGRDIISSPTFTFSSFTFCIQPDRPACPSS